MELTLKLNIVKVNKGHFKDEEKGVDIDYFSGTLSDGTQIKLSETVYNSLLGKKVPADLTIAAKSKLITIGETGTLL